MSATPDELLRLYREGQARHGAEAEAFAKRSNRIGNLRGLSFATFVVALGYLLARGGSVALAVAGLGLLAFLALVSRHGRVIEQEEHARRLELVNAAGEARVDGRAASLPETGSAYLDPAHPYASDLDLAGRGSLFQRISVAHTRYGKTTLGGWLSAFAPLDEVKERQRAVEELGPQLAFRQELEAQALALTEKRRQGRTVTAESPDPEPLLRFIEAPPELLGRPLVLVLAWLLPALTCAGIAYHAWGPGTPLHWAVPLLAGLALLGQTSSSSSAAFAAVSTTEGAFLRYGDLLALLEGLDCHAPWLVERKKRLAEQAHPGVSASRTMRRFRGLVGWFDLRHNGMAYPFIDGLLLWDIHCTVALERWKRDVGPRAREWFRIIGELEALCSLAGQAHDEPDSTFPELSEGGALSAEGLGHPLLPLRGRIVNDVAPFAPGSGLLVTGSNMSGKSTFLRALGVNAVLAFAGGRVVARRLTLPRCVLGTSIRVSDSLLENTSHFFAEVKKLAHVVELSRGDTPVLFLLDEVLHGTNSRERQLGARWVIADLLEHGAFGVVTTHDEGLCQLPSPLDAQVRQHHFRENVEAGTMTFDYQLREGPVTSGNALRLMRLVGLDVPLA
ncbi:MAG TPA: DNA mismatch repair protein MutS [Polyangiaceae bacterium]|nr:DNA mismatch repair protein MutS [Polyangiaceae bacterium]